MHLSCTPSIANITLEMVKCVCVNISVCLFKFVVLYVLILPVYAPFRLHVTTVHIPQGQKGKKNKTMGESRPLDFVLGEEGGK